MFACPNPDCVMFNRFGAGNLSVAERMGKGKAIRRLYCNHCQHRFSERRGSLMQYTHLSEATVVRVMKCMTYGCSVEATADICEVDARSVQRLMERAGPRSEVFHQLQLEKLSKPLEVVEMDELHAKVARTPDAARADAARASPAPPGDCASERVASRAGREKKGASKRASPTRLTRLAMWEPLAELEARVQRAVTGFMSR
jgi:transposase-like protein